MREIEWTPYNIVHPYKTNKRISLPRSDAKPKVAWDSIRNMLLQLSRAGRNSLDEWIYRGMQDVSWEPKTSLDRQEMSPHYRRMMNRHAVQVFSRELHLYGPEGQLPADAKRIEIMALMQHYGAPTPLLDWTRSPYVAAFFATEDAYRSDRKDGVIYALNRTAVAESVVPYVRSHGFVQQKGDPQLERGDAIDWVIDHDWEIEEGCILPTKPWRVNSRMQIQQGEFTLNGNANLDFKENLYYLLDFALNDGEVRQKLDTSKIIKRIEIPSLFKQEVRRDLELMNITAATLFPGLEGYARSFEQRISQTAADAKSYLEAQ